MATRGVRGATTAGRNEAAAIAERTLELLRVLVERNGIRPDETRERDVHRHRRPRRRFPGDRRCARCPAGRTSRFFARARSPCPDRSAGASACCSTGTRTSPRTRSGTPSCAARGRCARRGPCAFRATTTRRPCACPAGAPAVSRVAVVGLGLIGGSVALAPALVATTGTPASASAPGGAASRPRTRSPPRFPERTSSSRPCRRRETPALLREISSWRPAAILTDCASLKKPIVAAAQTLRAGVRFVAGHPMAGGRGQRRRGRGPGNLPGAVLDPRAARSAATRTPSRPSRPSSAPSARGPVVLDAERHDRAHDLGQPPAPGGRRPLSRGPRASGAGTRPRGARRARPPRHDPPRRVSPSRWRSSSPWRIPRPSPAPSKPCARELGGLAAAPARDGRESAVADYFAAGLGDPPFRSTAEGLDSPPGKPSA